ncbi:MAG: DedA family protein [Planctomycetota bacterium]|jgi:membrane protein DedA with SNARE-associated domain
MEDVYANLLSTYGPFTVFLLLMLTGVGIPLGEDLIVIPAGILIGHGTLAFAPTALFAYLGVVCADLLWFGICWTYGTPLLHKRWFKRSVHPRRLLEVKHEIEQRGAWVIVMSRFIPGSRTPAITAAGILHLSPWKFALAEGACCLATVPLQLGLGIAVAKGVGTEETADLVRSLIGVVILILAVLVGLTWWRQRRAHGHRLPRAKVAWLRRFGAKRAKRDEPPGSRRPPW